MDGASKYVRGDAVAGIIIVIVNVIGGLFVGVLQHDLGLAEAMENYTLLAIGDGLVAQIPSLMISIAAGVVVSRVASDQDIGGQLINQLFAKPEVLIITSGIVGGMGLIPGMPNIPFLLLSAMTGGAAYILNKKAQRPPPVERVQEQALPPAEMEEATWKDVIPVDTLGLEVGYRLIPLVDQAQNGELLRRIKGIRKKFARDIGFLAPPIHIRDNLELRPTAYRITMKGVEIGGGEAYVGQFLAIDPGMVTGPLPGTVTRDPAFGLPAVWIEAGLRDQAQSKGYTVVDASTAVTTHLNHLITMHADELLGRLEVQQLLDHLAQESPKLVEDLVPKVVSLSAIHKVLQNLLSEGVHIRDMRTILETIAEYGARTQDTGELSAAVRIALGRAIIQQIFPSNDELPVLVLEPQLERLLMGALHTSGPEGTGIEPGLADSVIRQTEQAAQEMEQAGLPAILLVPHALRAMISRFLRRAIPQLHILSHAELPDSRTIRVSALVGGQT